MKGEVCTTHPEGYIANPMGTDPGNYFELIGKKNGDFDVWSERLGYATHYKAEKVKQ